MSSIHTNQPGSTQPQPALLIENLTVRYQRGILHRQSARPAVDSVSLAVSQGEIVGLVGESGSGKSTIALAAAGLVPASSGTAPVAGQDLHRLRGRRQRRARGDVQVVFQDAHGSLDPRQTVRAGLRELRRVHRERSGWISDEDLMTRVGLSADFLGRLPFEISGGQAQRVCIARALLLRPRLIIADEPTSALDVSVQAQILGLLDRLRAEENISILFISHDLSLVRALCDRLYVLSGGAVVESGSTEAVLQSPQHDYTRRLIEAIPGKDRRLEARALTPVREMLG